MFEFADKVILIRRNRWELKRKMSRQHCLMRTTQRSVIFFLFVFNVGYNMTSSAFKDKKSSVLTYHRIIEAFKFSYAWRSLLGDPDFDSEIMVGGNNSVIQMPA